MPSHGSLSKAGKNHKHKQWRIVTVRSGYAKETKLRRNKRHKDPLRQNKWKYNKWIREMGLI